MTSPEIPAVTEADVFITRAFDAPREIVWRFLVEPELLTWFGPEGVHVDPASVVVEPRVGGAWHLDMVDDASGDHYPVRATLTAIEPPEYLEGQLAAPGQADPVTLRIWLHDHGDRTRLTLHQGPFAPEARDMTGAGWTQSFGKVDAMLASGAGR